MAFKQDILNLNHCLFIQMGATALVQDHSLTILNPRNPGHQQSNLTCRLRFSSQGEFETWLSDSVSRFYLLGLQPRYSVDELSTPSLKTLQTWFTHTKDHRFHLQCDTDVIMACTFNDYTITQQQQQQQQQHRLICPTVIKASLNDVEELVQLLGAAFDYGEKLDWLRYKLTNQINDPQTTIYATVDDDTRRQLTSVVIVNSPDGLPNLIHINVCGTHPIHQRKGLAKVCMSQALKMELKPGQTAYLEVYDEIIHAQRMYERIGFKTQGTLEYLTATLPPP